MSHVLADVLKGVQSHKKFTEIVYRVRCSLFNQPSQLH